jgi:hypothetical protein
MPTYQDQLVALKRQGFSDAEGQMFMARELEYMEARTFEVLYQDLLFRQLFPVDTSPPPGAKNVTYKVFDKRGKPRWLNTKSFDLPRADVDGREVTTPLHWSGLSYGFSMAEIEAARFAGVPLEQAKANAVRRGFEEEMNDVAFNGNADLGLTGFFSTGTGIPRTTAPNGAGGFPQWDTKTPDEIIADVGLLFSKPVEDTLQKERPTELWLPTKQYNDIANRRLTDTGETLFSYIVSKSPWITSADKIVSVPDLTGAGTGGVDVAVAASRNPDKRLVIRYPLAFHILEDI